MMEWSDNGIVIEIFLQIKGAKHKRCQNKSTAKYRHRLHVPHTTVYITHPWGDFPSSIARQPRGCHQDRTIRLRDALGEMFATPTFQAPTLFELSGYRAGKIGPGRCDIHRRLRYIAQSGHRKKRLFLQCPSPAARAISCDRRLNRHF